MRRDLLIDGMYGFERWRFCFCVLWQSCLQIVLPPPNWGIGVLIVFRSSIPRSPILSPTSWSRKDYHGNVRITGYCERTNVYPLCCSPHVRTALVVGQVENMPLPKETDHTAGVVAHLSFLKDSTGTCSWLGSKRKRSTASHPIIPPFMVHTCRMTPSIQTSNKSANT
jgi:hypothetical protein